MTRAAALRPGLVAAALLSLGVGPGTAAGAEFPALSVGGFARLHLLAGDISAARDRAGDSELWVPDIPVSGERGLIRHRMNTHARESRIWVRAVQATPLGDLEALVEADLDGDRADGHDPRLRHAYLMLGPLLAGHTYTTFTNTSALADLDSGIAVGNIVTRHRLVRWQQPLGGDTLLSLALEDSLNRLHFAGTDNIVSSGDRRPPDLVARLDQSGDWGNLSLSMLAREITTTGPTGGAARSDREVGTAFSLAGRIETGALDNLRFMFNYGNALARYSTLSTYADATVTQEGRVALAATYSGLVAWQHFWAPRWRSSFALSLSRTDPHRTASDRLTRESRSAHANLIWAPNQRISLGAEYLYGWRSLLSGEDGNLHRLQLTARVNF